MREGDALELAEMLRRDEWVPGKARSKITKTNKEIHVHPALDELHETIKGHALYSHNFVSRLWGPKFNWYRDAGEYRIHSDAAYMDDVRTDLAMTLFLSDDYEGGELNIDGKGIKAKPGVAVVYDCWKPHWVNPVLSGDRIAAIAWMQSLISDKWKRDLLNQLHGAAQAVSDQKLFAEIGSAHEKLLKHWSR